MHRGPSEIILLLFLVHKNVGDWWIGIPLFSHWWNRCVDEFGRCLSFKIPALFVVFHFVCLWSPGGVRLAIVLAVIGRVCCVCGRWRLCSKDGRDVCASIGGCLVGKEFVLPV